jgi:hypothetical protein
MRRLVKLSIFTLALGGVVVVFLISASIYTYGVLTDETLIAEIRFDAVGEQQYRAHLQTGDRCEDIDLLVYGDQWRVDAEFLKWKYWALLFGLDSQYRLDRLEGRYRTANEQNSRPTLSHDLTVTNAVDIVSLAQSLGSFNFLMDASYGSSTYQDIDTSTVHQVFKTPTGIFTRSVAPRPRDSDAEALQIEIDRACGGSPGYWQRVAQWTDAAVMAALQWGGD